MLKASFTEILNLYVLCFRKLANLFLKSCSFMLRMQLKYEYKRCKNTKTKKCKKTTGKLVRKHSPVNVFCSKLFYIDISYILTKCWCIDTILNLNLVLILWMFTN